MNEIDLEEEEEDDDDEIDLLLRVVKYCRSRLFFLARSLARSFLPLALVELLL